MFTPQLGGTSPWEERTAKKTLRAEDYLALAAFRYALRRFFRFSKGVSSRFNLTPEQYEVLLALKASTNAGLTVGEIGERLQVKHHTAVALTDKIVGQKLATKTREQTDRRKVLVALTPQGSQLIESLAALHRAEMRDRSPEMIKALMPLTT